MSDEAPAAKAPQTTSRAHVLFKGEDLGVFDPSDLELTELYDIEKESGLTLRAFLDGIENLSATALQTLVWLLKRRLGQSPVRRLITFKPLKDLDIQPVAEDPTEGPSGPNETPTSPDSPTTSTSVPETSTPSDTPTS